MDKYVNKIIRFWRKHHLFRCCDCEEYFSISEKMYYYDNGDRCIDCYWEYDDAVRRGYILYTKSSEENANTI